MDNKGRNIHNSGPLGMLMKSGQVKKLEEAPVTVESDKNNTKKNPPSYFKTPSGIEFTEHELLYVDPKECEPWKYANRQEDELGDIEGLIDSIKLNKQLQPALIRKHPTPHDNIKYEVIFGRRRHIACLKLGIPFLAIIKDIPNVQEAIASQHAENKFRNDVSNYSNAMLYKKLLEDGVFNSEKALAVKLNISTSSLNDLMAFVKIPQEIIDSIPDIHSLSKSFALKILSLANKSKTNHKKLVELAPQIGTSISSPARLEKLVASMQLKSSMQNKPNNCKQFKSDNGKKLFTFKLDQRGIPSISFHKDIVENLNFEELCDSFKLLIEEQYSKSGYPDLS